MIRCTLELVPGGIGEPEHLGTILISNTIGQSLETQGKRGTYLASIFKKRKLVPKQVKVTDYPRLAYHPWNLVREILNEAAKQNGGRL